MKYVHIPKTNSKAYSKRWLVDRLACHQVHCLYRNRSGCNYQFGNSCS